MMRLHNIAEDHLILVLGASVNFWFTASIRPSRFYLSSLVSLTMKTLYLCLLQDGCKMLQLGKPAVLIDPDWKVSGNFGLPVLKPVQSWESGTVAHLSFNSVSLMPVESVFSVWCRHANYSVRAILCSLQQQVIIFSLFFLLKNITSNV